MAARKKQDDFGRAAARHWRRLDRWTWARAIRAVYVVATSNHPAQKRAWRLIVNNLEVAEHFIEASPRQRPRRPVRDKTSAETWLRRQLEGLGEQPPPTS
jgi:hypothetical protein